jgi:transcription initiation factor TFIID subunit TAF12
LPQAIGTVYRSRYYFAWSLGESSLAFAGMDLKGWVDPQEQQLKHQQKQQQRQQQGTATDASGIEESETDRGTCDARSDSSKLVATWGRCNNALPFKVEFCDSSRMLAAYWNITTGIFLRR